MALLRRLTCYATARPEPRCCITLLAKALIQSPDLPHAASTVHIFILAYTATLLIPSQDGTVLWQPSKKIPINSDRHSVLSRSVARRMPICDL